MDQCVKFEQLETQKSANDKEEPKKRSRKRKGDPAPATDSSKENKKKRVSPNGVPTICWNYTRGPIPTGNTC